MPIYEFGCESCGHRFDRLQRMNDPDPESCPACEQRDVRRLISLSSFQLKGSGWYVTDYKGKNPAASSASQASTTSPSSSDSSSGASSNTSGKAGSNSNQAAA